MTYKDLVYIKHIIEAIKDIEISIKELSLEDFANSKDSRDACIRRLEIIGEAVKNISQETKNKYPKIEWKQIAGTRDRIIHAYFDVDLDIVWDILTKNLPVLKKEMLIIEKNLKVE
jgi:uncharacterized protein with HEPN domain